MTQKNVKIITIQFPEECPFRFATIDDKWCTIYGNEQELKRVSCHCTDVTWIDGCPLRGNNYQIMANTYN